MGSTFSRIENAYFPYFNLNGDKTMLGVKFLILTNYAYIESRKKCYAGPWSGFPFGPFGKLPNSGRYLSVQPISMCFSGWHFCTRDQLSDGYGYTKNVLNHRDKRDEYHKIINKYDKTIAFIVKTKGRVVKDNDKAVAESLRFVKKLTVAQMRKLSKLKGEKANKALHRMAGLKYRKETI